MARTAADQVRSDDLFTTALWGYSMDEVDAYVEDTARRMRRLAAEIQRLSVAENQLGAARIEISKLTSELAEARPLASVGPRVQAILRMAEREAETLRRTAFEVLRKAYEEAREVRQKAEDEAYNATRDYEIALAHRRRHDKEELIAEVMAEAAASAEPEPEPRETVGMRELFASASEKKRKRVDGRQPVDGVARKSAVEPVPTVQAGSDLGFTPDLEAERDVEPVPTATDARAVGLASANGQAAGSAPTGRPTAVAAPVDGAREDAAAAACLGPAEAGVQRDEPGVDDHTVPEVLEDEYPVIEEPVERFHNGSNKSRRKRARNQRANPANAQPAGSSDPAQTLPAKRP
ncbi:DivIVA domain-containing protein [Catellatospora vulcania]|uniref:DivIVA domain-containing protein n=1 Tax=Catellatospora vulcania TaxID=1460450 RepID=UPI0012D4939E|nr:hypothetical protein [Catellatospora vulcania]